MNVLVTGGAGYIGSSVCKALSMAGFTPVCYDNLSRGHRYAVKWGPIVEGDIRDLIALRQAIRDFRIEAVVHLAAFAYVGESMEKVAAYYSNNVIGSLTLFEAMHIEGVSLIVFSSSCAVYGNPVSIPVCESDPLSPISVYGETKCVVERALAWWNTGGQFRSVCLRYFNAAGADPGGLIGEDHSPETHVIPLIIGSALSGREFELFGNQFPTRDGTAVRDFVHVSDLADAHVLSLSYLLSGGRGQVINLGSEQGVSVGELIEHVETATGMPVNLATRASRIGDPAVLVADSAVAHRVLGWRASRSDIKNILSTAINWYSSQLGQSASGAGCDKALR